MTDELNDFRDPTKLKELFEGLDEELAEQTAITQELSTVVQAQTDLIIALIEALSGPVDASRDNATLLASITTKLANLPGLAANTLAKKYKMTSQLLREDPNSVVYQQEKEALETLLLKIDPDNLGDWRED